jgi:hypothetical protein
MIFSIDELSILFRFSAFPRLRVRAALETPMANVIPRGPYYAMESSYVAYDPYAHMRPVHAQEVSQKKILECRCVCAVSHRVSHALTSLVQPMAYSSWHPRTTHLEPPMPSRGWTSPGRRGALRFSSCGCCGFFPPWSCRKRQLAAR